MVGLYVHQRLVDLRINGLATFIDDGRGGKLLLIKSLMPKSYNGVFQMVDDDSTAGPARHGKS